MLHTYRSIFAFLHNREISENGGVFVTSTQLITSTAPNNSKAKGTGLNPALFGVVASNSADAALNDRGRRDGRIDRKVAVIKGPQKGQAGIIKDVTGLVARVELHTSSKVVAIPLANLKEQR